MMIFDNARAVDRIEAALRERPFCVCGAPTDIADRQDGLWLVCTREAEETGFVGRLTRLAFGHTRVLVLDYRDHLLTAMPCR